MLIMDKFLGESRQPDFDGPNPSVVAHQNVNVDEINNELNMLENSFQQQKKHGKSLHGFKKEHPYEQLRFSEYKKLSKLLEDADEEVERVDGQLMEYNTKFWYQTIGSGLSFLRVDENSSSNFNEALSVSNE
ncbi:hypothetical protein EJD97_001639 [Solanum chilense]|uniref:Uncharacterized protein n=1 Tax=Solanum chilense TaxID=4083 RepID=A0A6N2C2M6_SOLCI|nr:hypothetical protein EJD97_001639 [Solanum chilense]